MAPTASPEPTETGHDDGPGVDPFTWTPTAVHFAEVYLTGATAKPATWRARLAAMSTPALTDGFASTDPTLVPTGKITDTEVLTSGDKGGGVMRFALDTGLVLDVTVTLDATGEPKVADIEPAQ